MRSAMRLTHDRRYQHLNRLDGRRFQRRGDCSWYLDGRRDCYFSRHDFRLCCKWRQELIEISLGVSDRSLEARDRLAQCLMVHVAQVGEHRPVFGVGVYDLVSHYTWYPFKVS